MGHSRPRTSSSLRIANRSFRSTCFTSSLEPASKWPAKLVGQERQLGAAGVMAWSTWLRRMVNEVLECRIGMSVRYVSIQYSYRHTIGQLQRPLIGLLSIDLFILRYDTIKYSLYLIVSYRIHNRRPWGTVLMSQVGVSGRLSHLLTAMSESYAYCSFGE